MPAKRIILEQLTRDELLDVATLASVEVAPGELLVDRGGDGTRAVLGSVIKRYSRERLKELCRAAGVDDSGDDKGRLVERLLWTGAGGDTSDAVSRGTPSEPPRRGRRPKGLTLVEARAERRAFRIDFPNVTGFSVVKEAVRCDVDRLPPMRVAAVPATGEMVLDEHGWRVAEVKPGRSVKLTPSRSRFLDENPLHVTVAAIAHDLVEALAGGTRSAFRLEGARVLASEVRGFVKDYLESKVTLASNQARIEDVALADNRAVILDRLIGGLELVPEAGQPALLPQLAGRPTISTADVRFETKKPTFVASKTHASHVIIADDAQEQAARRLDESPNVAAFAKNDQPHVGIAYEWKSEMRTYAPDYLVRMSDGVMWLLEMEGKPSDEEEPRWLAARKWITAINNHGGFGKWKHVVCKNPDALRRLLAHPAPVMDDGDDCVTGKPFVCWNDREWWDRRGMWSGSTRRRRRKNKWAMDPPRPKERRWAIPCRCRQPWCDGVRHVSETDGDIVLRVTDSHAGDPAVEKAQKALVDFIVDQVIREHEEKVRAAAAAAITTEKSSAKRGRRPRAT